MLDSNSDPTAEETPLVLPGLPSWPAPPMPAEQAPQSDREPASELDVVSEPEPKQSPAPEPVERESEPEAAPQPEPVVEAATASVAEPEPMAASDVESDEDAFDRTVVVARGRTETEWKLVDIDGSVFPLSPHNILGRKPARRDSTAQLIALSDADRVLSRTHAALDVDDDGLWVTDLGSTNGTDIVAESGAFDECLPHQRTAIPAGHSLNLGGRHVSFTGPGDDEATE